MRTVTMRQPRKLRAGRGRLLARQPTPGELRRWIFEASQATARVRGAVLLVAAAPVGLLMLGIPLIGSPLMAFSWMAFFGVLYLLLVALFVAAPVASLHRLTQVRRLRQELARLGPEEQAAVLLPLLRAAASEDLRSLLEPLARGLPSMNPREISSSEPGMGRGDEVSAGT